MMSLDHLDKIKSVEAPPFLFTRIQQRINNEQAAVLPQGLKWVLSFSFILVMALNIGAVVSTSGEKASVASTLGESMNLIPVNDIYR